VYFIDLLWPRVIEAILAILSRNQEWLKALICNDIWLAGEPLVGKAAEA
jgi:hypothetical protein